MRQFETPMFCSMEPFTLFLSDKGNMKEMNKGLPRYCAGGRAPEPASSARGGGRWVRDAGGQPREPVSSARGDGRRVRDAGGRRTVREVALEPVPPDSGGVAP